MREEGVEEYLKNAGAGWDLLERLLKEKKLVELFYEGKKFYLRSLRKNPIKDKKKGTTVYYSLQTPCIMKIIGCIENVIRTSLKKDYSYIYAKGTNDK